MSSYKSVAKCGDAEKHSGEVTSLVYCDGKLYSGGDDGKIKVWTADLKLVKDFKAHPVNVYDLATDGKFLYSCSNDGTLKKWNVHTFEGTTLVPPECKDEEILKLYCGDDKVYAGDNRGLVRIWQEDQMVGAYGVMEEIYGLCAKDNILFAAGNVDIIVTELKRGSDKLYTLRKTERGRAPICLVNNTLYYTEPDGKTIASMDANLDTHFKNLHRFEAHEMIVNSMCKMGTNLCSAGYDKKVKIWDHDGKLVASFEIGRVVNSIVSSPYGEIYAASGEGHIEKFANN